MALFSKRTKTKLISLWPPFIGAGIRLAHLSEDFHQARVELRMRFWNRNLVGTHFGGSLYAMVDPFYMILLLEILGREYIVWDKAAAIRYKKPGRGTVAANFDIKPATVQEIKDTVAVNGKGEWTFTVEVIDAQGEVVCEVDKVIYVRSKAYKPQLA